MLSVCHNILVASTLQNEWKDKNHFQIILMQGPIPGTQIYIWSSLKSSGYLHMPSKHRTPGYEELCVGITFLYVLQWQTAY